eukprot:jgi/Ulvmu1/367/UM001_0374.1
MPATEIAGDFSGFGEQISSKRWTEPRARMPKGTRTYKLHEKAFLPFQRGQDAPAIDLEGSSSFGPQLPSHKVTRPKYSIPRCPPEPLRSFTPGPGSHGTEQHMESSLNAQIRSKRATEARCRIGTQRRFQILAGAVQEGCPGSLLPRPKKGWIGESSPQFSLNNAGQRYEVGKGFPGRTPTPWSTPAADYCSTQAMGQQTLSRCTTAPAPTVPKARRSAAQRQFVSRGHARERFGAESPGPALYDSTKGRAALGTQTQSRAATAPSFGFGSGDRFSQTAPRRRPQSRAAEWGWSSRPRNATESHFHGPGPGEYRVQ